MGNVVSMGGDRLVGVDFRVEPDNVLNGAAGQLRDVVVVGYAHDGSIYIAGSGGAPTSLWLCEKGKQALLDGGE